MVHTIPWESPSFASLNSRKPALTYKAKYRYLADLRSKELKKKKITILAAKYCPRRRCNNVRCHWISMCR